MNYSWSLFVVLAALVFGALKSLAATACSSLLVDAGLCLLAAIFADMLVNIMVNTLPRQLLPDLHRKAVLVTGMAEQPQTKAQ
ncbi:hypothetical protein PR048_015243 [Dryococelus australis]|uniref:Uncharacterized protein n=1 Tax=Dryococelus australis TaxID=614101 RepID=A0ABQ9HGJ8_9NEOP|nr:hypothetical protein PR048_015243 [Dryococelus australis]